MDFGFAVASTLTARTRPLCRFVFLQSKYLFPASFGFHRAACAPRLPLRGSLRLPPSVPAGSFHPARISPCWAHWHAPPGGPRRPPGRRQRGRRVRGCRQSNARAAPLSKQPSRAPKSAPARLDRRQQSNETCHKNNETGHKTTFSDALLPAVGPSPSKKSLKRKTLYADSDHQPPEIAQIADISAKICHSLPSCNETLYPDQATAVISTV